MEHSFKNFSFSDILIKNINGHIITDIFHKPADTQQYIHLRNHHPKTV